MSWVPGCPPITQGLLPPLPKMDLQLYPYPEVCAYVLVPTRRMLSNAQTILVRFSMLRLLLTMATSSRTLPCPL